jgi:hypothetical protein
MPKILNLEKAREIRVEWTRRTLENPRLNRTRLAEDIASRYGVTPRTIQNVVYHVSHAEPRGKAIPSMVVRVPGTERRKH